MRALPVFLALFALACDPAPLPDKDPLNPGLDTDVSDTDALVDDTDDDTNDDTLIDTASSYDRDGDTILDRVDNCPEDANTDQADLDRDDLGDVCDDDRDNDGVPNHADPFPRDRTWPGIATPETIYPHTRETLFSFNVVTLAVDPIASFSFDQGGGNVTDLAIDQYGVIYAITSSELFVCRPSDAQCRFVATLPSFSIGLTFLPPATPGGTDVLVGMGDDDWYRLDRQAGVVTSTPLGSFDNNETTASGDAFSIQGVGTFVSVNPSGGTAYDTIVAVDPGTGSIQGTIVAFNQRGNHTKVWGLAGWTDGYIYAFDELGDILQVDTAAGTYTVTHTTEYQWWGAAVRTIIPPT